MRVGTTIDDDVIAVRVEKTVSLVGRPPARQDSWNRRPRTVGTNFAKVYPQQPLEEVVGGGCLRCHKVFRWQPQFLEEGCRPALGRGERVDDCDSPGTPRRRGAGLASKIGTLIVGKLGLLFVGSDESVQCLRSRTGWLFATSRAIIWIYPSTDLSLPQVGLSRIS